MKIIEEKQSKFVTRSCSFFREEGEIFSYTCTDNEKRVVIQFYLNPRTGLSVLACPVKDLEIRAVKVPSITKENYLCQSYYEEMGTEDIRACVGEDNYYICFPETAEDWEDVTHYREQLNEKPNIIVPKIEVKSEPFLLQVNYVLILGIWGILGVIIGRVISRVF